MGRHTAFVDAIRSHRDAVHETMAERDPAWVPRIAPLSKKKRKTANRSIFVLPGGPTKLILALSESQGHRCCYCGIEMKLYDRFKSDGIRLREDAATIEHVTPRSLGGSNDISNLVAACRVCNNSRGASDAIEFFRMMHDPAAYHDAPNSDIRKKMRELHPGIEKGFVSATRPVYNKSSIGNRLALWIRARLGYLIRRGLIYRF